MGNVVVVAVAAAAFGYLQGGLMPLLVIGALVWMAYHFLNHLHDN